MLRNLQGPNFWTVPPCLLAHYSCPFGHYDVTKLLCPIKKPPFGGLQFIANAHYLRSVTDTLCRIFTGDFRLSNACLRLSPKQRFDTLSIETRTLRGTFYPTKLYGK